MNYSIIKELHSSKVIVVKVGSNILVDKDQNIKKEWLQSLAKDIKKIRDKKNKVVIVSSGAIALGKKTLGEKNLNNLHDRTLNINLNLSMHLDHARCRRWKNSEQQRSSSIVASTDVCESMNVFS